MARKSGFVFNRPSSDICNNVWQEGLYVIMNLGGSGRPIWVFAEVQVVIATECSLREATAVNSVCHQQGISFIRAETRGVFGTVFCDFGDDFEVHDVDGEILNIYQGLELNHK